MVLRLFYHHILQQYVGIYSVLFSYRSPIVLLLFSYCSPIVLLLFSYRSPIVLLSFSYHSPIVLLSFSYRSPIGKRKTIRKQYGVERKTNE